MSDIDQLLASEAEECRRAEEHYRAALFDEARHYVESAKTSSDTITALRAEVAVLRELLDIAVDDHDSSMGRSNVPAHWSNRARAALTQTKDTTDDA